jgi:hypothetical protein
VVIRSRLDRVVGYCVQKGVRAVALLLFVLGAFLVGPPVALQAQTGNQAGLVVVHGDGRVTMRCVTFEEPSISGLTLLQRAGLSVEAASGPGGAAICRIEGAGCPVSDCFCQCKGTPCAYWNYFYRSQGGPWTYASLGALGRTVQPGDVEGWVWGDGSTPPPALDLAAICSAGAVPIEPEATATAAEPIASPTPIPTATPELTATPTEVAMDPVVPTATATVVAAAASPSPTATGTAIPTNSPTPTMSSTPTASATAILSPTPERVAEENGAGSRPPLDSYVAYVVLILGLGGVFWIVKRRGR